MAAALGGQGVPPAAGAPVYTVTILFVCPHIRTKGRENPVAVNVQEDLARWVDAEYASRDGEDGPWSTVVRPL
jgi:hypothetical protein